MAVTIVTTGNFEEEVLNFDGTVLVDFWAEWCGPCKMLSPIVDEVANEHPEIKVVKINVDEQSELAQKYRIMSIPTLIVFCKGQEMKRSLGAIPKSALVELIG